MSISILDKAENCKAPGGGSFEYPMVRLSKNLFTCIIYKLTKFLIYLCVPAVVIVFEVPQG